MPICEDAVLLVVQFQDSTLRHGAPEADEEALRQSEPWQVPQGSTKWRGPTGPRPSNSIIGPIDFATAILVPMYLVAFTPCQALWISPYILQSDEPVEARDFTVAMSMFRWHLNRNFSVFFTATFSLRLKVLLLFGGVYVKMNKINMNET